jgi:predicted ATP-grasp superfamily ATP-dependent carboligase
MARILVTDASRPSALSIIRSLGRSGHIVVAADSARRSLGFSSRYAAARLRYPVPNESPEELVECLLHAARLHGIDLIVPVTEVVILPLDRSRARFADVCALALPGHSALATALDKEASRALAASLGIPVPRTVVVHTVSEAREHAQQLGWPVVLKPTSSMSFRSGGVGRLDAFRVSYADSMAALEQQMAALEGRSAVMLQEYCSGEGHGVELAVDAGVPVAVFQHRRLREVPFTGGASSFRESVPLDPQLFEYSSRLLAALEWTGVAMVEFKLGERGPRLMEVNGRVWGSLPLAVKSGVDFPGWLVNLYLPGRTAPRILQTGYSVGVRSRQLDLELVWIASVLRRARRYAFLPTPPRRAALAAAIRLLDPRDGYDTFARDDIRPGLVDLGRSLAKVVRKVSA